MTLGDSGYQVWGVMDLGFDFALYPPLNSSKVGRQILPRRSWHTVKGETKGKMSSGIFQNCETESILPTMDYVPFCSRYVVALKDM